MTVAPAQRVSNRITSYNVCYTKLLRLGLQDKVLLVLAMIAWLAYCRRLLAVVRAYAKLPDRRAQAG